MAEERTAGTLVTSENLAEFNAARVGLNNTATETEASPEEAKTPETDGATEETEAKQAETEQKAQEEEHAKKGKKPISERFSDLAAQRRAAEERAEAAEKALAEERAKAAPPRRADPVFGPEPDPKDYTDAFQYGKDMAEWAANKALTEHDRSESWRSRVAQTKTVAPDYEEVLASSEAAVSDAVRDAILDSDVGPRLLYKLAKEPELVAKLNAMPPARQIREIGRLEALLDAPAAPPPAPALPKPTARAFTPPPEPITPVHGSRPADPINEAGEFRGSYQEWKAARMAQKQRRH